MSVAEDGIESEYIPTIDFSLLSASVEDEDLNLEMLEWLSEHVLFALKNTGFLYLKNCGLEKEEVELVNKLCSDFFQLPEKEKQKFSRGSSDERNHGYVGYQVESLDPRHPSDLKEAFNFVPFEVQMFGLQWPNAQFESCLTQFYQKMKKISLRLLMAIAVGLNQDVNFFSENHENIGGEGNPTAMRCLYYPPLEKSQLSEVKPGQLRCGEHSDYGSVTLLVSEDISGLQVLNREGKFVHIDKSDDPTHILVNLGDLMQRWTDDEILAAKHRVSFNSAKLLEHSESSGDVGSVNNSEDYEKVVCPKRQSIAFFVHPDDQTIVKSLKGISKYAPISAGDYLKQRFRETYK